MKVNLVVDCTPLEARQFIGLPDVQPLQAAMMAELEKNMMFEAQRFSPEALMQLWFASVPQSADWFRRAFSSVLAAGTPGQSQADERK